MAKELDLKTETLKNLALEQLQLLAERSKNEPNNRVLAELTNSMYSFMSLFVP